MKQLILLLLLLIFAFLPVYSIAAKMPADGQYRIEAKLNGGSGRASVQSPMALTVYSGAATAIVIWSSPYYECMLLDGVTYYPIQTNGNATFEIPVSLDTDISFSALTVAMSEPHEIAYTLRFDSSTLKSVQNGIQTSTTVILIIAAVIVIFIIVATVIITRKRKNGKEVMK
ncbi:MAG: hypothetical protein RRY79_02150 [Clostridia bacterium]